MQYTQLDTAKITGPIAAKLGGLSLTTVQGYLGAASISLAGMAPVLMLYGHPKAAAAVGMSAALIGCIKGPVGQAQKDSGLQAAIPAGKTEPEMMPSHEEPNEAGAEVVK